jgi:hypothetical protein
VTIPSAIDGLTVTVIGDNAFDAISNLTSVTIPSSITNIGSSPSSNCHAFFQCYTLTGLYFQGNPPALNDGEPFLNDGLATVFYLPETAGWGATYGTLPTALWTPFTYTVNPNNTVTITGYTGIGGEATIPATITGLPVTSIGNNAFAGATSLTAILVPNSVTNIADGAFQSCPLLTGIYLQGNAPSVGLNVFPDGSWATVYYFSGNTNGLTVGGTFGGQPTALWLTVVGGTDAGIYTNLQSVPIIANAPVAGGVFDQWTGATQYVASATLPATLVRMPLQPVTVTATYYLPPSITAQPASQAVISGGNATFNVKAWGPAPLAYQWYFNSSPLSGAVGTNCILTGVTAANMGDYTVVVTNLYGSTTSSVAALTVLLPPAITTQLANQVAAVGGAVTLSAAISGTAPLSYQWFKSGGMISGATSSALSFPSAGVTDSGVYYVVVTNAYGLSISQPATVTVGAPQLMVWGNNQYGQLGDGTTTDRVLPESVDTNVVAAAGGNEHSLY